MIIKIVISLKLKISFLSSDDSALMFCKQQMPYVYTLKVYVKIYLYQ